MGRLGSTYGSRVEQCGFVFFCVRQGRFARYRYIEWVEAGVRFVGLGLWGHLALGLKYGHSTAGGWRCSFAVKRTISEQLRTTFLAAAVIIFDSAPDSQQPTLPKLHCGDCLAVVVEIVDLGREGLASGVGDFERVEDP